MKKTIYDVDNAIERFCENNSNNKNLKGITSIDCISSSTILKDLAVELKEILKTKNSNKLTHIRLSTDVNYLSKNLIYIDNTVTKIIDMTKYEHRTLWVESLDYNIPVYVVPEGLEFELQSFFEFLVLNETVFK